MELARTEERIRGVCEDWREDGLQIGFVPTMGALHSGHTSLVDISLERADRTVVSIFVNPTQFGEKEDLDAYPRDPESDANALREMGVDAVFLPSEEEMYPPGYSTYVEVEGVSDGLCGSFRPGHFRGVATVCTVLFRILRPHLAVFGRKDAQQLAVIRRLVRDLRLDVEVVAGPIVREPDGLALSSRNSYLSRLEREQATALYRGLLRAEGLAGEGRTDPAALRSAVRAEIESQPLLSAQYVELVDPSTMRPLERLDRRGLLAVAVFAGRTRLIDNILIDPPENREEGAG
ncbi:pantoate--beta-alanine ligase [Candidatus Fermentibacteria bacterium]|nr:pantoate--beta-alanine ligase [Candidatus Fermentibacteria bacterium]